MTVSLGRNIASLQGQRRLHQTGQMLSQVFERLSSGQRINRASDDAAGLAIADSLNVRARVFNQGLRNFNDGLSLLNIADSSLSTMTDIVIRLEELASQAANGTFSSLQRSAINTEAQELAAEYLRIAQSSSFNGQSLFNGNLNQLLLQGGFGSDGVLRASLGGAIGTGEFEYLASITTKADLGSQVVDLNSDGNADFIGTDGSGGVTINLGNGDGTFQDTVTYTTSGTPVGLVVSDFDNDGVYDVAISNPDSDTVDILKGNGDGTFQSAVTIQLEPGAAPTDLDIGDFNGDGVLDIVTSSDGGSDIFVMLGQGDLSFNKVTVNNVGASQFTRVGDFNGDGNDDIFAWGPGTGRLHLGNGDGTFQSPSNYAITSNGPDLSDPFVVADSNGDGIDDLASLTAGTQLEVRLGQANGTLGDPTSYNVADFGSIRAGDLNGDGIIDLVYGGPFDISVFLGQGDGTFSFAWDATSTGIHAQFLSLGDFNNDGVLDIAGASQIFAGVTKDGVGSLLDFSLETLVGARAALPEFKERLAQLAEQRGQIGATQARIQVALNVMGTSSLNFRAAESRIRDADIAGQTAELTRLSILQQAASAVLGQANLQPGLALSLLG